MRAVVLGAAFVFGAAFFMAACSSSSSPPQLAGPDGGGGDGTILDGPITGPDTGPPVDGQPLPDSPGTDANPAPSNDVSDQYTSGSRLRAKWLTTTDGFQLFMGWHDTQLSLDCFFVPAADGQMRCLPAVGQYANGYDFADAACTQPLAYFTPYGACTTPPSLLLNYDNTACPTRTHIYAVGVTVGVNHYALQNGTCMPTMGQPTGTYYALGPELSPSMYAIGTPQNGPAGAGLIPSYIAGADGSKGFDHWTEATGGASCYFAQAADSKYRCMPASPAFNTGDFADATCTVKAFGEQLNACPDPTFASFFDQACPALEHVFALGGQTTSLFLSNAGVCTATPPWTGYRFFSGGAEMPAATFPEVTLASTPAGPGRLKETDMVTGSGLLEASGIVDTGRSSEPCFPAVAGDGQFRCLPGTMFSGYFSDMNCTQPLAGWIGSICGPAPAYAGSSDLTTCPPRNHVYTLGPAVAPATVFFDNAGMCLNVGMPSLNFYGVGAEVPAASFQALTPTLR